MATMNGNTYQALRARLDARLKEHADSCAFRERMAHKAGMTKGLCWGYLIGVASSAALVLLAQSILFPGFF